MNLTIHLAFLLFLSSTSLSLQPSENYLKQFELEPGFTLFWSLNGPNLTFELHFTKTWSLFGLSHPSRLYADIIVGWLNKTDLTSHFSDRHMNLSRLDSIVDLEQNWALLFMKHAKSNKGITTVLKFTRYVKLCDTLYDHDVDISKGLVELVFASGDEFLGDRGEIKINRGQMKRLTLSLIDLDGARDVDEFECASRSSIVLFGSKPVDVYQNFVDLVPGLFRFFWNVTKANATLNITQDVLIGEMHCKTLGWVGFGLSSDGNMDQSDVVVGWVSNGTANFTVREIYRKKFFF